MTSPRDVLAALSGPVDPTGSAYAVRMQLGGSFAGRAPSGHACLLVPLAAISGRATGRVSGSLGLAFRDSVSFDVLGRQWQAACAVVECLDEELLAAFSALAVDLSLRLTPGGDLPTPADVASALAEWERLLRSGRRLTRTEEIGLWGELALLDRMPNVDDGIRAWRGPFGGAVDFFGGGLGIECKATTSRLRHHFSLDQTLRPVGDFPVYFASLWIGEDSRSGRCVAELATSIRERTTEPILLERALLAAGHSARTADMHDTRYVLLEQPMVFSRSSLPQVHQLDPGVLHVRYEAQLDELDALDPALADRIIGRLEAPSFEPTPNPERP
jgi:hypothetical protein